MFIQLPGRSDNEIKNFWHKRAKKCKREKLPIYPSSQNQNHTNDNDNDEVNAHCNNHHTPSQFQPPTPNIVTIASHAPTIHSPQSIISTSQPQFLSQPTTTLLNTPTSLTHNTILSNPTESNLSIPDHLQPSFSTRGGGGAAFASLTKLAPILSSSPLRRFLRAKSQFPPHLDSSLQMESPRSPLNLKLSPGFPPTQLNSPTGAPLSPLKLRLSAPVPPSETCFQTSKPIPDAEVELDSPEITAQTTTVETDRGVPLHSSPKGEPPSIQFSPPENSQVESDSNMEIMEELRKAQARVRFLKNKLKKSSRKCPETMNLSRGEAPLDESSSQSTIKDCASSRTSSRSEDVVGCNAPPKTPRKKDVRRKGDTIEISTPEGLQIKKAKKGKTTRSESSVSKISSEKSLPKEDSPGEILKRINSENLFLDHLNSQDIASDPSLQGFADKCSSSMEDFLSESSALLQEGFFNGDFSGQTSLIENPFSSQRHAPLVDAFAATTPGDEHGQLISYLQPDDLGLSFMDGCGSDLLMHQNTSGDLLDLDFLRCDHFSLQNTVGCSSEAQPSFMQLMEQESETAKIHESGFVQHQIPETSLFDSRFMMGFEHEMEGLLGDNLWPQGQTQMEAHDQTVSVNQVDSAFNPMESMMNWNNESTSGYTGGYL